MNMGHPPASHRDATATSLANLYICSLIGGNLWIELSFWILSFDRSTYIFMLTNHVMVMVVDCKIIYVLKVCSC